MDCFPREQEHAVLAGRRFRVMGLRGMVSGHRQFHAFRQDRLPSANGLAGVRLNPVQRTTGLLRFGRRHRLTIRRVCFVVSLVVCMPVWPIAAANAPMHRCDRLAADPVDYERIAPPVEDTAFLPQQALAACREAVAAYPDEPRFRFQLARALLALRQADEAREALKTAGDKGYAVANLYLGRLSESRANGEHDLAKAFEYYRLAAEQGHQGAQIGLGLMYRNGAGVETDSWQAFNWFQKAADQGNPHAHFYLGTMYSSGEQVPPGERPAPDFERAAKHFRVAAEAGLPSGQFALGYLYLDGFGVEKDPARGLALLEAAANQGFVVAALELGKLYMNGERLPRDQRQAVHWFCKAGAAGNRFLSELHDKPVTCTEN